MLVRQIFPKLRGASMFRLFITTCFVLVSVDFASCQEAKVADDSIREVIEVLKKRLPKIKNKADVDRINLAIRSLESVISASKVTRENFMKVTASEDLNINDAEAILGPGRLVSKVGGSSTYEWRGPQVSGRRPVIITLTLRNTFTGGRLDSSSIID